MEIARALSRAARIIVMDEPTAALTAHEIRGLFASIRALKAKGVGVIYISHRLEELAEIGDRVTVGHGAIVHGCTVGPDCIVGMGAVITSRARIGAGSIIGAGAVVPEGAEIPEKSWAYRLAKRFWFNDFGAYRGMDHSKESAPAVLAKQEVANQTCGVSH